MGLSKAEVKLRRLLNSMPNQENPRKLVHYVATAKELLLELTGDNIDQSLSSISSSKAKEYAKKIEEFNEKINALELPDLWESLRDVHEKSLDALAAVGENREADDVLSMNTTSKSFAPSLRKREVTNIAQKRFDSEKSQPLIKLETSTTEVMDKHRQLQENLTDEMVILAQQMKETTIQMERSLQQSEKVLDSTEQAVEYSLAKTNRANITAKEVSSRSWTTGIVIWLLIFAMCCIFLFMVAVIRVT